MRGLDTNFLVAALVGSVAEHARAVDWLSRNDDRLTTTPINVTETLRLLTHPKVFPRPASLATATQSVIRFVDEFGVEVLTPPEDLLAQLHSLVSNSAAMRDVRGNGVFDACIALTLRHHAVKEIVSQDADFDRFTFLKRLSF